MSTILEQLEKYKVQNPIKELNASLISMSNHTLLSKIFKSQKLTSNAVQVGLILCSQKNEEYYSDNRINMGSTKCQQLLKYIEIDSWQSNEYLELLVFLFGEDRAKIVQKALLKMPNQTYQHGFYRRSFRAPHNKLIVILNQVNFITDLLNFSSNYSYEKGRQFYKLSFINEIRYDNDLQNNASQFLLWSTLIDEGDEAIFKLIEDIVFSKDEIGKVSRNIIKALLNSNKTECWILVEKLLLAAQRQEGLRQTILESLDETSVPALFYMIKVIIDQKLSRFSSVIRAIDTWTGLGWQAEKETLVRTVLELAQTFFNDPSKISTAIKSKNNQEVYMALWVQGVLDIYKCEPLLNELFNSSNSDKQCLAIYFANQMNIPEIEMPFYYRCLQSENLHLLSFAIPRMNALLDANVKSEYYLNNPLFPDFFEKLIALTTSIKIKEKSFDGKIFSWLNSKFSRDMLSACAINLIGNDTKKLHVLLENFDSYSIQIREKLTKNVLKDHYSYSYYSASQEKNKNLPVSDFQRSFALSILKDRGESIVASAINTLSGVKLKQNESDIFEQLLKRKGATLRKNLIELILKQDSTFIYNIINSIVKEGDLEQRLACLDIILQLKKQQKAKSEIPGWIKAFSSRLTISDKELLLLEQLTPSASTIQLTAENGYGLYDPTKITPYSLPVLDKKSIYSQYVTKNNFGFSRSIKDINLELNTLLTIFNLHKNHEYTIEHYDGSSSAIILGNEFNRTKINVEKINNEELFTLYPLYEIWDEWFQKSKLQPSDLHLLTLATFDNSINSLWKNLVAKHVPYSNEIVPQPNRNDYHWRNQLIGILNALKIKYPFDNQNDFYINACIHLFSNLPKNVLKYKFKPGNQNYYYGRERGDGWQSESSLSVYLEAIDLGKLTDEQIKTVWNIYRWRQFSGLKENIIHSKPPVYLYCRMYANHLIHIDELYDGILDTERISVITGNSRHYQHYSSENIRTQFPFLNEIIDSMREKFLDVEMKRGDSSTNVTKFVQSFQRVEGIQRFKEIIVGLGKGNLYKGYIYSWGVADMNKQKLFSTLLKKCFAKESDTQELFNEVIDQAKISESRLIQAAVYAPQWQKHISSYLKWKGLDSAIWWMHAHTKTTSYAEQNAELESEVAKHSSLDIQEFKDGAVDKDWFDRAYKELGKAKWELVYDAAKFVTDGNGHRRARLYADTLLGDLKIREVTAKVKEKRDQDYLRVFGLVPLSKTSPEKDILSRYEYLLQFKKESRDFGSMKQTSEALAMRVAMENLARNAGYPDPMRLTWAMETKQVQKILSKDTTIDLEGTLVQLYINNEGKADFKITKDEKNLKAIPAKFKKHPAVIELTAARKMLREQFARSKKGLEEAMVRGDLFSLLELQNLIEHPVISAHIGKLVFITSEQQFGFFNQSNFVTLDQKIINVNDATEFRIAHCVDFHVNNCWIQFQEFCFHKKLVQPFKQIFRELYVPTADELSEKAISRRYAGHQVQPRQALALFKSRGWKVDYSEGLQKVYHKEKFLVKLYAMADWFSPSDIESPTLETIEFHSLSDYKNTPFEKINPRIFSEVMRDIDLVVSIAHVGGVDPESSHSTIEMRRSLITATISLFKFKNVSLSENHAIIKGTMGEYSVHLGSAIVHQVANSSLSIIPIHSQHRGRIFLPFADDDPKSAEVLSKIILLANDQKIQDPTILSQITRV